MCGSYGSGLMRSRRAGRSHRQSAHHFKGVSLGPNIFFSCHAPRSRFSLNPSVFFLRSPDSIDPLHCHASRPQAHAPRLARRPHPSVQIIWLPVNLMYILRQQPPFCFIKHEVVSFPMCDPRTAVYAETGCLIVRSVETPDSLSPHFRIMPPSDRVIFRHGIW